MSETTRKSPCHEENFDDAAEAAEEFDSEQIDQVLLNSEKQVQNSLFNHYARKQSIAPKNFVNSSTYIINLEDHNQLKSEISGIEDDKSLMQSIQGSDSLGQLHLSQLLTFEDIFNILKNFATSTINITDTVVSTVGLSFQDKIAFWTRRFLNLCDAGIVILPVAFIKLFGFGTAYSLWFMKSNVFTGTTGMIRSTRFYTKYIADNNIGWFCLGSAPLIFLYILNKQRKIENYFIFKNVTKNAKEIIREQLLCKTIIHKALIDTFNKVSTSSRSQSRNSNNSDNNLIGLVNIKPNENTPIIAPISSRMQNLVKNKMRKKVKPDTEDWDSVSDSPNKSYQNIPIQNDNDDKQIKIIPEESASTRPESQISNSTCSSGTITIIPDSITDMNPFKNTKKILGNEVNTMLNVVGVGKNDNNNVADTLIKNYKHNIVLKTKEENSSLRILSDLGWSMLSMPVISKMISATGIWNFLYNKISDLIEPKTYYETLKETVSKREVNAWVQAGMSIVLAMAVKSYVRVNAMKALLR